MLELNALRSMLGFGPTEGEAWFHLPEKIVQFAPQKPDAYRAIILRTWGAGATAVVFPRSTADQKLLEHSNPGHTHQADFPECWLHDTAWVVLSRPIPVAKDLLGDESRLCSEEHPPTVSAVLAAS
jgi:hypothetical protein